MPLREIFLILHLLGLGLFVATLIPGYILDSQYRKATDIQTKATLLHALMPIGLLSPFAALLMLATGIANMHYLGVGLLDLGWLTAKIIFFALAVVSGAVFGAKARKRGKLIQQMAKGETSPEAEARLKELDKQQRLFYVVQPILLVIIIYLSVYGRLGGQ